MKWDELNEKLQQALSGTDAFAIQSAMIDIIPSIRDDYDAMNGLAERTATAEGEVERLKQVLQDKAMTELLEVAKNPTEFETVDEPVLGDDVLQEIIDIHNDVKEADDGEIN